MNTITYSAAFDCLILEREGHSVPLCYKPEVPEDYRRLFRILKHWADLDREPARKAEAKLSPEAIAQLQEAWRKEKTQAKQTLEELDL